MSRRDRHDFGRFIASLALFAFVAIVIPIGLVAVSRSRFGSANPLAGADPPWQWFGDGAGSALGEPIADDALTDGLIRICLCVIWLAVAVIVLTTVLEVVHGVRHRGIAMPAVRGLGPVQRLARFIAVGIIIVLPVLTPAPSIASTIGRAPPTVTVDTPVPATVAAANSREALVPTDAPPAGMTTHIVQPGESVYSIAEHLAGGGGARVIEIADAIVEANLGATMSPGQRFTSPAYIEEGWALQVPTVPVTPRVPTATDPTTSPTTYEVQPGDTLWDIADDQLGDPTNWPEIWERNRGRDMGGGRTFDDPNLILPGWDLEITDVPAVATPTTTPPAEPPATTTPTTTAPASVVGTTAPVTTAGTAGTAATTATTTTVVPPTAGDGMAGGVNRTDPTSAPSPIRLEHAALLAAGILALVGVRRRRRLRAARPRHRVPAPRPEVTETERRLRSIDAGERTVRVDVACRAAAWSLVGSGVQIGWVQVTGDGDVELRLTGPATLPAPWTGGGQGWRLDAEVPIELLADDARRVGLPCIALVQLGVSSSGADVLVDLEACATLAIEAPGDQADEVVTALATGLASSMYAEVAHLVGVSLPAEALLGHRNAHRADSVGAAFDLASELVATGDERTTFELRSLHTSGEMWEPAVILLTGDDSSAISELDRPLPLVGRGIALAAVIGPGVLGEAPARLVGSTDGWRLLAFGTDIELTPIGISTQDLDAIVEVLADADRELISMELEAVNDVEWADHTGEDPPPSFVERDHEIVVSLLGGVEVHDARGRPGAFERSKTVELIAWLATHRERATRSGARTALWELDVRDATFANVVSEARRGLARLVAPPAGEEWVARTLTEQLPLHESVVTDADLVEDRLAQARLVPPGEAIETLRPAVAMIRDMPFAGTSYLWPDAEGITSNLVLLAITAASEFAGHALSTGDTEGVFWATAHGLRVLPGHEDLIGLRMQAHARAGDLAGVRQEWEAYERVLVADAWSDGEPAPKLLALRRELLAAT